METHLLIRGAANEVKPFTALIRDPNQSPGENPKRSSFKSLTPGSDQQLSCKSLMEHLSSPSGMPKLREIQRQGTDRNN